MKRDGAKWMVNSKKKKPVYRVAIGGNGLVDLGERAAAAGV